MPSIRDSASNRRMAMSRTATPAMLILDRAAACRAGDFAFVYDSYLDDSNFRRQFPHRQEYLDYAREVLAIDFVLHECRVLRERISGEEAAVLFYQRIDFRGEVVETLELAHLRLTVAGWRLDRGEKLERRAVARPLEAIDWDDFAAAVDKVVF